MNSMPMPEFLPILILDERRLTPSFGYVFDSRWLRPYESIISMLWKYIRVNALAGHVVAAELGHEAIDPYEGVEAYREAIDILRLKKALGVTRKVIRQALIPEHRRGAVSPCLRYCPRCMGRGYHSVIHQFESVSVCPIHDQRLAIACRYCGYMAPYRLNARLLEKPFVCPECHGFYGARYPNFILSPGMPMKDLIRMRRTHVARCRFF